MFTLTGLEIVSVVLVVPAVAAIVAMRVRLNGFLFYFLGCLLAFFGVLGGGQLGNSIAGLLGAATLSMLLAYATAPRCSACREIKDAAATVCPHCHTVRPPATENDEQATN